jgi:hypothetical protein
MTWLPSADQDIFGRDLLRRNTVMHKHVIIMISALSLLVFSNSVRAQDVTSTQYLSEILSTVDYGKPVQEKFSKIPTQLASCARCQRRARVCQNTCDKFYKYNSKSYNGCRRRCVNKYRLCKNVC